MRFGTLFVCSTLLGIGALNACGSDEEPAPKNTDTDAGVDGGIEWCGASGVSKGPWALHVDGQSALLRWEACREGTSGELSFGVEGGALDQKATATLTPVEIPVTYLAALAPKQPQDLAGTYYMHEAALTGLEPGKCYAYQLAQDASRKGRFCTARPSGQSFKILAMGDTNPGLNDTTVKLLALMDKEGYDLTLHAGDIQYYASGLESWQHWFGLMAPMFQQGAFLPAVGNHEYEQNDEFELYYQRFWDKAGFDGKDGLFRAESGGLWFFFLNTETDFDPGSAQVAWFKAQLEDAAKKPGYRGSIVTYHKPMLTCGDMSQNDGMRAELQPLFEQHGVRLVLQGHMHGYERFEVPTSADPTKTLTYLTVGGGGGLIGKIDANIDRPTCSMRVSSGAFYQMTVLEVGPSSIKGRTIDVDGKERDAFEVPLP
ncbi:MAG: metallophosphoesterase family protein [Myxococcales bacterium]|nr:metallophosphoesterase family protein [Myxococcales bacterium]